MSKYIFDFYMIHHVVTLYYGRFRWIFDSIIGRELGWKGGVFFMFCTALLLSVASYFIRRIVSKKLHHA